MVDLPSDNADDADEELAFLLRRAGIVVPPERWAAVVAEYTAFRPQLELVNQMFEAGDEPAFVFQAQPAGEQP